eukprot:m.3073 g.3073  ORF g.3073 m.3073 type:complete len:634 (-) comp2014_c0_seq1:97-1998(-)
MLLWNSYPANQDMIETVNTSFVSSWANEAIAMGYCVTDVNFNPTTSNWVVVAGEFSSRPFDKQLIITSSSYPASEIASKAKAGFFITSIAASMFQWVVILSSFPDGTTSPHLQVNMTNSASEGWVKSIVTEGKVLVTGAALGDIVCLVTANAASFNGLASNFIATDSSMDALLLNRDMRVPIINAFSTNTIAVISGGYSKMFPSGSVQVVLQNPTASSVNRFWAKYYSKVYGSGLLVTSYASGPMLQAAFMTQSVPLEDSFDGEVFWPNAFDKILNQEQCGSCFIFSTTEALAFRAVLSQVMPTKFIISPEPVVSCADIGGCNGGYLSDVYDFMKFNGSTSCTDACTTGCAPYVSGSCTEGKDTKGDGCVECMGNMCRETEKEWEDYFFAQDYYELEYSNQYALADAMLRLDLTINGPSPTCFTIYNNFYTFFQDQPLGIYNQTSGANLGGHCVTIVGWGVDETNDMPYWIVRNSWGEAWGDSGRFKYIRNRNLGNFDQYFAPGVFKAPTHATKQQPRPKFGSSPSPSPSSLSHRVGGGFWSSISCEEARAFLSSHSVLVPAMDMLKKDAKVFFSVPSSSRMLLESFLYSTASMPLQCEIQPVSGYRIRVIDSATADSAILTVSHNLQHLRFN